MEHTLEKTQSRARKSINKTKLYFLKKEAGEILNTKGLEAAKELMKSRYGYRGVLAVLSISGGLGCKDAE